MPNVKVKTAVNKSVFSHDNSGTTIATLDFGKVICPKFVKVRQGDRFSIDYSQFTRLAPMAVPTYGSFMLRTHAFFVPTRVVWPGYGKWLVRESDPSVVADPLKVSSLNLSSSLLSSSLFVSSGSSTSYDFVVPSSVGSATYLKLTARGRVVFSILRGLGYVVVPLTSTSQSSTAKTYFTDKFFDMRPLLSFCRVFYDWLYPSVFVQQQGFGVLFSYESHTFSVDELRKLFSMIFVAYDHDFYVDAWQDFNAPVSNEDSSVDVKAFAPDNNRASVVADAGGSEYKLRKKPFTDDLDSGATSDLRVLSAYGLRMLQSVADYWTRHRLVGSRFLERAAVQYGFVSRTNRHDYSEFLKTWSDDVLMMDVTQQSSSTSESLLGEQAGKGLSKGSGSLRFEASEDGYLVFVSHLVPKIGYVQGLRPWCNLPQSPFDEFTPELEDVGMAPLPKSELYGQWHNGLILSSMQASETSPYKFDGVFGFVPRYSEYKRGFDELLGDFIVHSLSSGGASDAYHTFRIFNEPLDASQESIVFAANDAAFRQVGNQYDRVFSKNPVTTEGDLVADHFYCYFGFHIVRYNKMKPMLATIPLFDKSGEDVNASYLGEQLH